MSYEADRHVPLCFCIVVRLHQVAARLIQRWFAGCIERRHLRAHMAVVAERERQEMKIRAEIMAKMQEQAAKVCLLHTPLVTLVTCSRACCLLYLPTLHPFNVCLLPWE